MRLALALTPPTHPPSQLKAGARFPVHKGGRREQGLTETDGQWDRGEVTPTAWVNVRPRDGSTGKHTSHDSLSRGVCGTGILLNI